MQVAKVDPRAKLEKLYMVYFYDELYKHVSFRSIVAIDWE